MAIKLHRGDCLEILPALEAKSIDLILCDLPYGTTQNKWDSVIPLDLLWAQYKRVIKHGGVVVLTSQQPFSTVLTSSNLRWLKTEWIWEKSQGTGFLNAKKYPLKAHENILVFCEGTPSYNPQMLTGQKPYVSKNYSCTSNYGKFNANFVTVNEGTRYPTTVLKINNDKNKDHPTQKPVALMEYLILTYTQPGDTVLDNCMGSGTTGVACVNTCRSFVGIEQDAKYFAIAEARINAAIALRDAS
jgi:site-specific DNA-methyltransferase (adenine-specific)